MISRVFGQCCLVAGFLLLLMLLCAAQQVKIDIPYPIDEQEIPQLTSYISQFLKGLPPGSPVAADAENEILQLGLYLKAQCIADRQDALTCNVTRKPIVNEVHVVGLPLVLLETELRKRLSLRQGDVVDIHSDEFFQQLDRVRNNVQAFLIRSGYFDASVETNYYMLPNSSALDVVVDIHAGQFLYVDRVTLDGSPPVTQSFVERTYGYMCRNFQNFFIGLGSGSLSCYSKELEREATKRLKSKLDDLGYVESSIRVQRVPCAAKKDPRCVDLNIIIDTGPKLVIDIQLLDAQSLKLGPFWMFWRSFLGVEFFSRALDSSFVGAQWPADETILVNELKKAATFRSAGIVDDRQIQQSVENMKAVLQQRGYMSATISAHPTLKRSDLIRIEFNIVPRMPSSVTEILFVGNKHITSETLLNKTGLSVLPRSAFHTGHYNAEAIDSDIARIVTYYMLNGFDQSKVSGVVSVSVEGRAVLTYSIEEGHQRLVDEIRIEPSDSKLLEKIYPTLDNCQNWSIQDPEDRVKKPCSKSPFILSLLTQDQERIANFYRTHGYLYIDVQMTRESTPSGERITFTLAGKNEPEKVIGLILNGNVKTESSVILRELGAQNLDPQHPMSLLKLDRGLSQLRQTHLFSRIGLQLVGVEEEASNLFAVVNMIEKPSLTLDTSFSFSTDNLFAVDLNFRETNLFGTMLDDSAWLSFGLFWGRLSILENKLLWPRIGGAPVDIDLILPHVRYEDEPNNITPERHLLIKGSLGVSWQAAVDTSLYIRYSVRFDKWQEIYRPISFLNDPQLSMSTIDGLSDVLNAPASTRGIIEPGIKWVKIDNPFNPQNGSLINFSLQYSGTVLGGQDPYTILNAQFVNYFTFYPITFATQVAIRRAFIDDPLRDWWILKYQSDMTTLGGDRSVRGYEEGAIGILGPQVDDRGIVQSNYPPQIHPGNLNVQLNLEARFPLAKEILFGDLYGAVFTDFGYVGMCKGLIRCDASGDGFTQLFQKNQLGWSVGVGLRYLLPVGPIALDYGVSPITRGNGIFGQQSRIHVLFGYPF